MSVSYIVCTYVRYVSQKAHVLYSIILRYYTQCMPQANGKCGEQSHVYTMYFVLWIHRQLSQLCAVCMAFGFDDNSGRVHCAMYRISSGRHSVCRRHTTAAHGQCSSEHSQGVANSARSMVGERGKRVGWVLRARKTTNKNGGVHCTCRTQERTINSAIRYASHDAHFFTDGSRSRLK